MRLFVDVDVLCVNVKGFSGTSSGLFVICNFFFLLKLFLSNNNKKVVAERYRNLQTIPLVFYIIFFCF